LDKNDNLIKYPQAHLQLAQSNAQTKNFKRACFANADKIVFKKFSNASKKIHQHAARQTQQIMTRKFNIDKAYSDTKEGRPAGNRVDGSAQE
jgi:hypothetical protein